MHHGHQKDLIFGLLTIGGKGGNPGQSFISFLIPFVPALWELKEMNLDRELFVIIVEVTVDHNPRVPFTLDIRSHHNPNAYI
jgi:hypothetical protein